MLMNILNDLRVGRFINYVKFAFLVPKQCLRGF